MTDPAPGRPWAGRADGMPAEPAPDGPRLSVPAFAVLALVALVVLSYVVDQVGPVRVTAAGLVPTLLLGGVLLGLVGTVPRWFANRRHVRLEAWGRAAGWAYEREDPDLLRLQRGAPFDQGDEHVASEVLHRPWHGRHAVSFTYRWTTRAGSRRRRCSAHVVALHLPTSLPRLDVTAEGLGARARKLVGGKDLQLELEDFNREYLVVADDERTAHAVLHPRLVERLMEQDVRGRRWRVEGRWLVTWEPGRTDVDRIARLLAAVTLVADAVPRHVWQDHGHDPAAPAPASTP